MPDIHQRDPFFVSVMMALILGAGVFALLPPVALAQPSSNALAQSVTSLPRRGSVRLMLDSGPPIYTGLFEPGNEVQQVKFKRVFKGRYFSLDTFSALDGRPFAAVAELDLLDETGRIMDRTDWKVAYADS